MEIELLVRERASGRDVCAISLHWQGWCRLLALMMADRIAVAGAGTLPAESPGQATATRKDVSAKAREERPRAHVLVKAWLNWMRAKNYAPGTVTGYRSAINVVLAEADVVYADELTAEKMINVIEGNSLAGIWEPSTHNKYLYAAKCFTKWLAKRTGVEIDLSDERKAKVREQDHSRALTTRECREVLREMRDRARLSKKASKYAELIVGTCMLSGLRPDEPWKLQWRHVDLDHDIPHWHWTPDISKNNRTVLVPMHPALAAKLREHRESMRVMARLTPTVRRGLGERAAKAVHTVDPSKPDSVLFPVITTRHFFSEVVASLGFDKPNKLGHVVTPKSCREWFITQIGQLGTPDRLVATMARHIRGSHDQSVPDSTRRYEFHELAIMRQWVQLLPNVFDYNGTDDEWLVPARLVPDLPTTRRGGGKSDNSQHEDLTSAPCMAEDVGATRGSHTHGLQDQLHRMSGLIGSTLDGLTRSDPAACETAVPGRHSPNRDQRDFESTHIESANQGERTQRVDSILAIAGIFECLARVLRGVCDGAGDDGAGRRMRTRAGQDGDLPAGPHTGDSGRQASRAGNAPKCRDGTGRPRQRAGKPPQR